MILRELVTRLGFELNESQYTKADKGFERLKDKAGVTEAQVVKLRQRAEQLEAGLGVLGVQGKRAAGELAKLQLDAARAAAKFGASSTEARKLGEKAELAAARLQQLQVRTRRMSSELEVMRQKADAAERSLQELGNNQAPGHVPGAMPGQRPPKPKGGAADTGILGSLGGLRGFVATLAGGAAVRGALGLVEMASDARETSNLLEVTFGAGGKQNVDNWATSTADSIGRSQHQLRDYAGNFGAFLKGSVSDEDQLQSLSQQFSERVIDLASFRNLREEDAMEKLRAGLAGETEPLRAIGVDVSVGALEEYAKAQGKSYKDMSKQQQMLLRTRLILDRTSDAEGDAVKTADEYANATRGMSAAMTDLGAALGERMRPLFGSIVRFVRDATRAFMKWQQGSNILESTLLALGAAAAVAGGMLIAPFLPAIGTFLLIAAAIAAAALVMDDLHQLFTGGKSIIGEYIDELFGMGTTDTIVRSAYTALQGLKDLWYATTAMVVGFVEADHWAALQGYFDSLTQWAGAFVDELFGVGAAEAMVRGVSAAVQVLTDAWQVLQAVFSRFVNLPLWDTLAGYVQAIIAPLGEFLSKSRGAKLWQTASSALDSWFESDAATQNLHAGQVNMEEVNREWNRRERERSRGPDAVGPTQTASATAAEFRMSPPELTVGAGGAVVNNVTVEGPTVNVHGSEPALRTAARRLGDAAAEQRRRLGAAVVQTAG